VSFIATMFRLAGRHGIIPLHILTMQLDGLPHSSAG
jgi:hypothetical protein